MARNRMLNPEFWLDEEIAKLKPHTRLLYMGLWNICDDNYATLPNRPDWIKAQVFPYEKINTPQLLGELSGSGKILLFLGSDGQEYWFIKNFFKYQRVEKPSKPKYPEFKPELEIKKEQSGSSRGVVVPEEKRREEKIREERENQNTESSLSFLNNIPLEVIKEFSEKFDVYEKGIRKKGEELYDWVKSKGKESQYKDFKAMLRNALRKDFGERTPVDQEQQARIRATQERAGDVSSFAKDLKEKFQVKK